MITEDYVDFEIGKLLKEKGFDGKCKFVYTDKGHLLASEIVIGCIGEMSINNSEMEDAKKRRKWKIGKNVVCLCPTFQMVTRWLREVHGLHIDICANDYDLSFSICIKKNKDGKWNFLSNDEIIKAGQSLDDVDFSTYDEAIEAGIRYCLENLI